MSFRGGPLSSRTPSRSLSPRDGRPYPFLPLSLQRRGSVEYVDREADSKDYCNHCPCRRMHAREATRGSQGAQEQSRSPEDVASAIRLTQLGRAQLCKGCTIAGLIQSIVSAFAAVLLAVGFSPYPSSAVVV